MRKKLLAGILAASMVFSLAPVLPVNTAMVASAEDAAADTETLAGTAWWTANQFGKDYTLPESGSLTLYVGYTAAVADGAAFNVELKDSTPRYFTTGSNIDGWCDAGTGTEGTVDKGTGTDGLVLGHMYKITVTREGQDFTVEYYDVTDDKVYNTVKATGTNLNNEVVVHIIAQLGTYMVGTTQFEMPDVTPATPVDPGTEDPGTPADPGTNDGTDFSAIETQPVVKYTFDNADGLELAGEAKVEEGILKLATSGTMHETYAKIADITSNDFSNGITLTTDFMVSGWTSDWTPIFMMGDGTLGGMSEDATMGYHLTQGFSSREDKGDKGYFGNAISAPYTWDFFGNAGNWNTWYTLTLTVTPTKMTTYVNGIEVQSLEADYSGLLANFSNAAKNNYLGASYWADVDFVGSLDNVAIYNTALSAEEAAALVSAEPATPDDPGNNGNDEPTPSQKTMKITKVTAKKNATKITGTVSVSKATVKVKVGSKAFKKATVSGKKFTIKVAKLKKGTTIKVKATKSGYKAVTKSVKVK